MVGTTTSEHYIMDPGELAEVLDRPPLGVPPIHTVTPVHLFGRPAAKVSACRGGQGLRAGKRRIGQRGRAVVRSATERLTISEQPSDRRPQCQVAGSRASFLATAVSAHAYRDQPPAAAASPAAATASR